MGCVFVVVFFFFVIGFLGGVVVCVCVLFYFFCFGLVGVYFNLFLLF